MEKQLGQESIDALFAAAQAATGEPVAVSSLHMGGGAEPFNFSRAGQISNEQMRAISSVNDLFARSLMHALGAWLRTQFDVMLVAGEQLPYGDFVERLSRPGYVCSMRLEPFDAVGLMELDLTIAWPMVDVLLGGLGQAARVRELTDIEEEILGAVVRRIVQELNAAWKPMGLQMSFERRETEDQLERMMPPMERTLCVSFEIRVPEAQGVLNLCFPASAVNAILRRLMAQGGRPRRRPSESRVRMRELMGEVKMGAVLQFPPVRLRAEELAGLAVGSMLRLPLPKHSEAELRVGGLMLARAHPVRTGEHRGAQVECLNTGGTMVGAS
jgi:flagellar motor switch protein FliM